MAFGQKRFLGVDIGTSSLKAVELVHSKNGFELATYGRASIPSDIIRSEEEGVVKELSYVLKQIVIKAKIKSKKAIASVPGFAVFTKEVELPKMSFKELNAAVKFAVEKYLPMDIDKMVLDWEMVEKIERKDEETKKKKEILKILVMAAPRNLIQRYVRIFEGADLILDSLETEALALVRSLVPSDDLSPLLILDLGATAMDIIVVEGGFPRLTRAVDTGGNAITKVIATSLNIGIERAEQFKKDTGLSETALGGSIPGLIKSQINSLISEIKQTLSFFYSQGGSKIEKIILSGGSAKLKELPQILKKEIGVEVFLGNPWAAISYPQEIEMTLKEIGLDFAVAIGLAMKGKK